MDKELSKVIPFGVYDIINNKCYVNVVIDHDTSVFAFQTIRQWWYSIGIKAFPNANRLLIVADSSGSKRQIYKLGSAIIRLVLVNGIRSSIVFFHILL
jgi:hypothetical protein